MNELAPPPASAFWGAGYQPLHMTADEFLLWEGDGSGRRFLLVDGEVCVLPPASVAHGVIQANLCRLFLNAIEASSAPLAAASNGAVIPGLHAGDNVRVPALTIVTEASIDDGVAMRDPLVLVEIQWPGGRSLTRDNMRAYATLPSVREIVVVHISRMEVEVLCRDETGVWPANPEVVKPGGNLRLQVAGLDCPVERVYARTGLARRGAAR